MHCFFSQPTSPVAWGYISAIWLSWARLPKAQHEVRRRESRNWYFCLNLLESLFRGEAFFVPYVKMPPSSFRQLQSFFGREDGDPRWRRRFPKCRKIFRHQQSQTSSGLRHGIRSRDDPTDAGGEFKIINALMLFL